MRMDWRPAGRRSMATIKHGDGTTVNITDYSNESIVGIATINLYKDKLTPLMQIDLKIRRGQQVVVMTGPKATLESNSFGWGRFDKRSTALSQATSLLGLSVPPEVLQQIPPGEERIIQGSKQSGSKDPGRWFHGQGRL